MRSRKTKVISILLITFIIYLQSVLLINALPVEDDAGKKLNILIINSYDPKDEWEQTVMDGFYKGLDEAKDEDLNISIELEYLDIKKRNDDAYIKTFNELLNQKYQGKKIDLVFTIDDAAFNVVRDNLFNENSVFYKKKILFTGVNQTIKLFNEEAKYMRGINQTLGVRTSNMILNIHENVDTINILLDEYTYSNELKSRIIASKSIYSRPVKVNFIQSNKIGEVEEKLRELNNPNQAIILNGVFLEKEEGKKISLSNIVDRIKKITDNPIYTTNYSYMNKGVIGGYLSNGEEIGRYSGKEAINILKLSQNIDVSVIQIPGSYVFDYEEITKYNIDPGKIPSESIIFNKPKFALLIADEDKKMLIAVGFVLLVVVSYSIYDAISKKKMAIKDKKLYELAKEREKLKTDFIVNMSHELRTPLNVILSTSKVTEMSIKNGNLSEEYLLQKLEQINKNSNRLLKLVNNLIDITKFESGIYEIKLENLNIVEVVEDVVLATVDYSTCKNIELIFDTAEEEIITAIDKDKIERMMLNLLSNAIKYTNENGSIRVYIYREKDRVYIRISDTGIGIPKDKLEEIFNRFYQVEDIMNRNEEGSGIGLCLVEEIVTIHDGVIDVKSQVGKGSTFEITLPIYKVLIERENRQISDINQAVKLEMSDVDSKYN